VKPCPLCGAGKLRHGLAERTLQAAGVRFTMPLPAQTCDACGESLVEDRDLERFELQAADWLGRAGSLDREAFRFMRKALSLPAVDLARLLGVTPETVSRWENGQLSVEHRAFALVGALVSERVEGRQELHARLVAQHAAGPAATSPREVKLVA
jgi:putative zinc finger/helix-turn-helix YgiT family protein